jgi:hypothetical protein
MKWEMLYRLTAEGTDVNLVILHLPDLRSEAGFTAINRPAATLVQEPYKRDSNALRSSKTRQLQIGNM